MSAPRRGRPPLGDAPATKTIRVRVTDETARELARIARINRTNRAAFIREAIDEAVSDCSDQRLFRRR